MMGCPRSAGTLDELCPEDDFRLGWVASNCVAAGYSLEEAFSLIANWARQRRSLASVLVAAELFGAEASRALLPLFDQLVDGSQQQAQLRAAVHFAVKVHSLAWSLGRSRSKSPVRAR